MSMRNVGTLTRKVNTQAVKLFICPNDNENKFLELQDKSFSPNRNVLVEAAGDGGAIPYTGVLNAVLSGTLLLTSDMLDDPAGFSYFATIDDDTKQLPVVNWKLKMVDWTRRETVFTMKGMLETFDVSGGAEGAVKCSIGIRITEFDPDGGISVG